MQIIISREHCFLCSPNSEFHGHQLGKTSSIHHFLYICTLVAEIKWTKINKPTILVHMKFETTNSKYVYKKIYNLMTFPKSSLISSLQDKHGTSTTKTLTLLSLNLLSEEAVLTFTLSTYQTTYIFTYLLSLQ